MLTNKGLIAHAKKALGEKWGYVWGTFGSVLTQALLTAKLRQYPEGVGNYESFIRANWLNRRVADCVGLIKSYMWWNGTDVVYNANQDVSANGMYGRATEKGAISTMPDIPGLCLWKEGHVGVYIGNGLVIESHGTKYGVIQTPLKGPGATPWTHWFKCPFISYEYDLVIGSSGDDVKALQEKLIKIGYKLVADGFFGQKTEDAVRNFQNNVFIKVNGIVDNDTMEAIDNMVAKLEGPKRKNWIEILRLSTSNPTGWENAINAAVKNAQTQGDSGALEIFKYLPTLIEKIYYSK